MLDRDVIIGERWDHYRSKGLGTREANARAERDYERAVEEQRDAMTKNAREIEEQIRGNLPLVMASEGLSQTDVAKATGISQSMLSKFLRGERSISFRIGLTLAQFLGMELRPKDES